MPLETNIEYRKRKFFSRLLSLEILQYQNANKEVRKIIYRWQSYLSAPRNFSDLQTNIFWLHRHITKIRRRKWDSHRY